ncbi:MAG: ATP-grasp domain-containing protein [Endozoicomonas sp. (ex Botrylloides leachii)]|nr:ATP-grasp domain-containing protein [Endozoicomonas sp. (ex Botrylloides leachii)]
MKKWLIINRLPPSTFNYRQHLANDYLITIIPQYLSSQDFSGYNEVYVSDSFDKSIEVDSICEKIMSNHLLSGVIAMHKRDLIRAEKLRDILFKRDQNSSHLSMTFRNKYYMKSWLKEKGIEVPRFCLPNHHLDILHFIKNVGFPIIGKPICGSSSVGIKKIKNVFDLNQVYIEYYKKDSGFLPDSGIPFIFEEWINGDMFHADGFFSEGKLKIIEVSKYFRGCSSYREGYDTGSYLIPKNNTYNSICNIMSQVAYYINDRKTVFHAEFFSVGSKIYVCEIALRPAGAKVTKVFEKKTGINLYETSLKMQTNESYVCNIVIDKSLFAWLAIPKPKKNTRLERVLSTSPFASYICAWDCRVTSSGDYYKDNINTFDYSLAVVFKGESTELILQQRKEILEWYEKNIIWS